MNQPVGSGVQSLDRALQLLEHLADAGGSMRLAELEAASGLPLPTIHRLIRLVGEIGETANMAVLEGDAVIYVAHVPSPHSMRMFTEVGRRVGAHCTGVGKAILAQLPDEQVRELLRRTGMPARTPRTHTDPDVLLAELGEVREQGWAVDDAEEEIGVRCVAAPVHAASTVWAVSVSGPSGRITRGRVAEIGPVLQRVAASIERDLRDDTSR